MPFQSLRTMQLKTYLENVKTGKKNMKGDHYTLQPFNKKKKKVEECPFNLQLCLE